MICVSREVLVKNNRIVCNTWFNNIGNRVEQRHSPVGREKLVLTKQV